MKTISIKQPWASLIVKGIKPIENRTWPTKYRGRVLVHAGAKPEKEPYKIFSESQFDFLNEEGREHQLFEVFDYYKNNGAIIGSVEIVDCVINHESIWADKRSELFLLNNKAIYNWVLANPIKFPEPIPAKGKLSFWDYPNILAEPEEKGGELFCHCQLPVKEINQVTGDSIFGLYCRYCGGKWYK